MIRPSAFRLILILTLVVAFGTRAAMAFEVVLRAPGAPEEVVTALEGASLMRGLDGEARGDGQQVLSAARADYARLTAVLYEAGYFGPVVSIRLDGREAAGIPVVRAPARVARAVVDVTAGKRFAFGRAVVAPLAPDTTLPDGFRTGGRAGTTIIREAVEGAVDGWRAQGHATAAPARQQITAVHPEARLNVDVRIDPGPRLRFGVLRIEGETAVRHDRIQAIAGLPAGMVFDPAALERSRLRLQRTGTFRVVALREGTPNGGQLPIEAQVVDRLPRTFGFGAELSSTQGLTLSSYWIHRNLRGGAERLRLDAEVSGIGGEDGGTDVALAFRFDRPATLTPDRDLYALGRLETLDEVVFEADRLALEIGFVDRESLRRTFTYGIGIEVAESTDAFGTRDTTLLTFPLSAEFDYRDSQIDPTRGYYGKLTLKPFVSVSGSAPGLRSDLDARYYQPLGDRVVLALRGQIGSLVGPDADEAPAYDLYYSGGGGTVRGQPFQSLGVPVGGDLAGGRSFIGLSGELRVRTGDRLSIVGFVDAGYVGSESFPDGTSGDWHSGAGVGLRYATGVGPIRFDVATPIEGPGNDGGIEVYIGIGQAF